MPLFGYTEQIIIAATVTLVAAWIKLLRHDGDPLPLVLCGLLAYFFPIVGPIAVLFILSRRGTGERAAQRPPRWIANADYTWLRESA